jgi:phosphoglycerol transferase
VFVKRIERTLGPGGAVFQLPYLPFPEAELSVPPYGMVDYDPLRGYLHSDDLSWGYGGTRGRAADWQAQVVELATPKLLDAITAVGFDGLWIDTLGYPNRARQIIGEVEAATGESPIRSPDGRFVFFDLRDYATQVRAELGAAGVRALRTETLENLR